MKVLSKRYHFNDHTAGYCSRTQNLEPACKIKRRPHASVFVRKKILFSPFSNVHTMRFSNFLPVHTKKQCGRLKKVRFLMGTCAFFSTRHRNVIVFKILRFNSSTLTSTTKRCFQKSPLCRIACNEDVI